MPDAGVIAVANSLFPVRATAPTLLTLGTAALEGFEIPESITFGSEQRTVVNEYVGDYKRVVQVLGAQPRAITWRGIFLYDSALDRAVYFQTKCRQGLPLQLTWGDFNLVVLITQFHFDPLNAFHVPYEITCTVVRDDSPGILLPPPTSDTITQGLTSAINRLLDLSAALQKGAALVTLAQRGNINAIVGQATSLGATISGLGSSIAGLPPTTLQLYQNQATIIINQAKALQTSIGQSTANNPLAEAAQIASNATTVFALLQALIQAQPAATVPVMNDSLFRIASSAYGDVTLWVNLADYNNLKLARIVAPTTLKLPEINGIQPNVDGVVGTAYEANVSVIPPAESVRKQAR